MSPVTRVHERLYRILGDVARRLKLRGSDPALELAGRFGFRRFLERHRTGDDDFPPSHWLGQGASLRKEARAMSRALRDAGVAHCFFKGIALLGRFYRIDERQLADIDLLVDVGDSRDALAVLHSMGYGELGDRGVWRPSSRRPGVTLEREDPAGGDRGMLLDLHWGLESLASVISDETIVLPSTVWGRVEYQGGLPVLPDEYHAALVLHHFVRHDLLHARSLLDFALLWEALPHDSGQELSELARSLGVERALRVVGRVMVDDLLLYPLRGVRLGPQDWRDRVALRYLRLAPWLMWAARNATAEPQHVTITRSRVWRRFLLGDWSNKARLLRELLAPPSDYLRWRWPSVSRRRAWRRHLRMALRA